MSHVTGEAQADNTMLQETLDKRSAYTQQFQNRYLQMCYKGEYCRLCLEPRSRC